MTNIISRTLKSGWVSPGNTKIHSIINSSGGSAPADGYYFMSDEVPGPNSVLTDNQRRGNWYTLNADESNWATTPPGWAGTIFADTDPPANGAAVNLQAINKKPLFATSDYVATTGVIVVTNNYMADHNLLGGSAGHNEIYFREYTFFVPANYYGPGNPSVDYLFGPQKTVSVNKFNGSGIYWASIQYNLASGEQESTGTLKVFGARPTGTSTLSQNQGNDMSMVAGNWYFIEWRIKLNTNGNSDGVWQLWINNGGPTGDFSGQSPTLRASYTNVNWGYDNTETELMGNLWLEAWSPFEFSSEGEQFRTNFHAATSGPIGFV